MNLNFKINWGRCIAHYWGYTIPVLQISVTKQKQNENRNFHNSPLTNTCYKHMSGSCEYSELGWLYTHSSMLPFHWSVQNSENSRAPCVNRIRSVRLDKKPHHCWAESLHCRLSRKPCSVIYLDNHWVVATRFGRLVFSTGGENFLPKLCSRTVNKTCCILNLLIHADIHVPILA